MNQHQLYSLFFLCTLFLIDLVAISTGIIGCTDKDDVWSTDYGYVQFKIYKSSSGVTTLSDNTLASRAVTNQLEQLSDACKVKVVLQYNGSTITQTLILNSYNDENAEYGLRSEKLELLAGEYTVVGFYLYDIVDELLYTGTSGTTFTVDRGGLVVHTLLVDAVERGSVSFKLVKALTRATDEEGAYPFENISLIDITVKNLYSHETTRFDSIVVTVTDSFNEDETYVGSDGNEHHTQSSYGKCEGIFSLKAGDYQISSYTTYSDKRRKTRLETVSLSSSETFTIEDNKLTEEAEVPIQLSGTADYIKDYLALKAIWDKMGGEKWSYYGEEESLGVNWNFNKDIDLWGDQPGVTLNSAGRVVNLSLTGFGITGNLPDEIGQLEELTVLYLGSHTELIGGTISTKSVFNNLSTAEKQTFRMNYKENVLAKDLRDNLSDGLKDYINRDPNRESIKSRISKKDVQSGVMTNGVTGISRALMRCQNLTIFYVANSPMTDFFVDVEDESYSTEGYSWEEMTKLTDVEIYNTKLTSLPVEMLTKLPNIESANFARNPQIDGETLLENWKEMMKSDFANTVQIIYLGYNNLEDTPEFLDSSYNQFLKLALLDLTYNKLTHIYPFGKEINLMDLYLDYNELTEIPVHTDGYFFGYYDVEDFSCSYNKLKTVPNAFNARSNYVIESLDFSHNEIVGVGVDENGNEYGDFKGINVTSLDLSYNQLREFPSQLFSTASPINVLNLTGNGITEIREGDLEGTKSYYLETLDLSHNQLESLTTSEFSSTRLPYLYGLGLSYNKFSSFPLAPLYNRTLTVMEIRSQRDDEGNRCLREWPTGLYTNVGLRAFYIGSNDLRKIDDTISTNIYIFEIADNPNIQIDMSSVCSYIEAGYYMLIYDKTQDIRGCDSLLE